MRIVVAPQEFKGSLTAVQAAEAIVDGLRRALPDAELLLVPMADGGPGTVEAVVTAKDGRRQSTAVRGPLGAPVDAAWGIVDGDTAVIEMAAASGLVLAPESQRDPRVASTYGTGQLIDAALAAGCRRIIVGMGGSATNDGGAGLAQALGARLLDDDGLDLPPGGAALARLARIDVSGLDPRLGRPRIFAATDVFNPLCGPQGASAVYGPQKGATPEMVHELDAALDHYAAVIERDLGVRVLDVPGAGAAGGLGAGLVAFLGAEIVPGAKLVADAVGLQQRIADADLVIAGEGRLDAQTGFGKAPWEVARLAREAGVPVIAIAGAVREDCGPELLDAFDAVATILPRLRRVPPQQAMARGGELLANVAEQLGRLLSLGRRLGLRPSGRREGPVTSLLDQFRRVGRDLYTAGLVSSHGGNLSVRRGEAILITTHGSRLGHLTQRDLVEVTSGGAPAGEPSVDLALHRAIYAAVPQAQAVVHAHPRHAIALSLVSNEIRPRDAEGQHYLGMVPVVAGDGDVAAALATALRQHKIAMVAGHGSYAWGEDLWQALQWTSVLEESAEVLWLLRVLTGES